MSFPRYQEARKNTCSMGITEIASAQSERAKKKHRKKQEGTDGIDTADEERSLDERFKEAFEHLDDTDDWD